jgi:UDP-N-acetylglucosamine 2-epimerase (non-hydrolysing)
MSEVFRKLDAGFNHILVHTGQHYDPKLSDVFFKDLNIREPDFNLSAGSPGRPHYEQVADLSVKATKLCLELRPDLVVFLGDSNSVLASIPIHKEGFKIAHIEAGMRSYHKVMLEETNRVACDHVSDMLFVYHNNYKKKAMKEGIAKDSIYVVGNTIVEPLLNIADLSYKPSPKHIILDIHRPENFKHAVRLTRILETAAVLGKHYSLPVKMLSFSRTKSVIDLNAINMHGIEFIDLMGYKDFIRAQQESLFVYSDSGSAQEESALLGIPVLVPRDFTERPESVDNNCSMMIYIERDDYLKQANRAVTWLDSHGRGFKGKVKWLGDGRTSDHIIEAISENI